MKTAKKSCRWTTN